MSLTLARKAARNILSPVCRSYYLQPLSEEVIVCLVITRSLKDAIWTNSFLSNLSRVKWLLDRDYMLFTKYISHIPILQSQNLV